MSKWKMKINVSDNPTYYVIAQDYQTAIMHLIHKGKIRGNEGISALYLSEVDDNVPNQILDNLDSSPRQ